MIKRLRAWFRRQPLPVLQPDERPMHFATGPLNHPVCGATNRDRFTVVLGPAVTCSDCREAGELLMFAWRAGNR